MTKINEETLDEVSKASMEFIDRKLLEKALAPNKTDGITGRLYGVECVNFDEMDEMKEFEQNQFYNIRISPNIIKQEG